jgi:hypothetical protein
MVGTRTQGQQDEPQGSNPAETSQMVRVEALMKLIERINPSKPASHQPSRSSAASTMRIQKHSWRSAKRSSPTPTLRCGAKRSQHDSGTQRPNGGASTHHSPDLSRTWRRISWANTTAPRLSRNSSTSFMVPDKPTANQPLASWRKKDCYLTEFTQT